MSGNTLQPRFPLFTTLAALLGASVILFVLAWTVFPTVTDEPATRSCILFAGILVSVISMLTMIPVAILGPMGLMPTMYGVFGSMAVRMGICLGGAIYANRVLEMPRVVLVASLMWFYLPLMLIEMASIGRYVWQKDFIPQPGNSEVIA